MVSNWCLKYFRRENTARMNLFKFVFQKWPFIQNHFFNFNLELAQAFHLGDNFLLECNWWVWVDWLSLLMVMQLVLLMLLMAPGCTSYVYSYKMHIFGLQYIYISNMIHLFVNTLHGFTSTSSASLSSAFHGRGGRADAYRQACIIPCRLEMERIFLQNMYFGYDLIHQRLG